MLLFVLVSVSMVTSVQSQSSEVYSDYQEEKNATCTTDYCKVMSSTTCEEFITGTEVDTYRLVNVDWKIFYFWNFLQEDSYQIRFSVPSKMLIDRYKIILEHEIPEVDWSDAELFLETNRELSGLMIRTNTSGLYRLISMEVYEALFNVPPTMIALKMTGRYLGMLNCEQRICFALAPLDKMPGPDEVTSAAAELHFRSEIGRSYLTPTANTAFPAIPLSDEDDQEDEWYLRNTLGEDD